MLSLRLAAVMLLVQTAVIAGWATLAIRRGEPPNEALPPLLVTIMLIGIAVSGLWRASLWHYWLAVALAVTLALLGVARAVPRLFSPAQHSTAEIVLWAVSAAAMLAAVLFLSLPSSRRAIRDAG